MEPLQVRNLTLGTGTPAICVPVMGSNTAQVLHAAHLACEEKADLVEWRADYFEDTQNPQAVAEVLQALRERLGNRPLLFTFRTQREGGERALAPEAYTALNRQVAASGLADLLDVEADTGEEAVRAIGKAAKAHGTALVLSHHNFAATPPREEMVARLFGMQALGADIAKIAVMPHCATDVAALLGATAEAVERGIRCPLITMAMGPLGIPSRVSGAVFGSCVTFGAVGGASAPGQLRLADLRTALRLLQPPAQD